MTDEPDRAGIPIKAALFLFALLLSALALLAGCNLRPQKEAFLFTDDEHVLFVQLTRVDREIRGTIDISEKIPDNEIKTTHIAFDGVSEGDSVLSDGVEFRMNLKSSWTAHGGDKELKREGGGFLACDTLMLPLDGDQSPPTQNRSRYRGVVR